MSEYCWKETKRWQDVSWANTHHDEAWVRFTRLSSTDKIFVIREGETWYYLINDVSNKQELPGVTNAEDAKAAADVMWRMA